MGLSSIERKQNLEILGLEEEQRSSVDKLFKLKSIQLLFAANVSLLNIKTYLEILGLEEEQRSSVDKLFKLKSTSISI